MTIEELLAAVAAREDRQFGVGVASDYLKGMFECRDGVCGFFPEDIAPADQWQEAITKSASQLVYTDEDAAIETKNEGAALGLSKGSILDFIGIMTSNSKDRDGDILETKGAEPDPNMPLLWMHSPWSPTGKLESIPLHTYKRMKGHFSVMDTELGQDCAYMVEYKALSLSIGFNPIEWKRMQEEEGKQQRYPGVHYTKFGIHECSLVTIRANQDAVITGFSRGKFHSPMVKLHAAALWGKMPATVRGGWEKANGLFVPKDAEIAPVTLAIPDGAEKVTIRMKGKKAKKDAAADLAATIVKTECGCHAKAAEVKEPTTNQLATKLLARLLVGEHLDPRLAQSLQETLVAEDEHSQERALAELLAG